MLHQIPQRFLADQRFIVKCKSATSKSAKESCGSPQGTVSLLWLFLTCVEDLLQKIKLFCLCHEIEIGMFVDDLASWTSGADMTALENRQTKLLNKIIEWNNYYNMIENAQPHYSQITKKTDF